MLKKALTFEGRLLSRLYGMSREEASDHRNNRYLLFLCFIYTRKNAQLVTSLRTSCYKSVHKLSTSCVRTACSQFVVTSLEQAVNNL